ncbi:MAG: protein-glutamine glutaminase family protein [Bacteriovoracaceae bacterium]
MKFAFIVFLLITQSLFAEVLKDRIHSIEKIENSNEYLVKFENGRVAFVTDVGTLARGHLIQGKLNKRSVLENYKTIETEPLPSPLMVEPEAPEYVPTVLTREQLNDFWDNLKVDYKRKSECSDRAFIWAFEGWKKHGYQVEMVYALFTASYINRHRFKWWFHVAPLLTVKNGDKIEKMVIDHQFIDRPVPIREWTDLMVFTKRECKPTDKFSEYDVNPQTEDCYLMTESMFYRIPAHLSDRETKNLYRTEFNASEVRMSYRLGFKTGVDSL